MKSKILVGLAVTATMSLAWIFVAGHSSTAAAKASRARVGAQAENVLRTAWGDPDLQGIWTNATDTPLERPAEFGKSQLLSATELERQEEKSANNFSNEPPVIQGDPGTYNAFWRDAIKPTGRTSLIVDPPDGRIPPLTVEAKKRRDARSLEVAVYPFQPFDGPEDRPYFERCIGRGWPRVGGTYQFIYQIVQNPQYVIVFAEMVNERHIIRLDGSPHTSIRQWMGDARGHWEGDTLIVDTINFPDTPNSLLAGIDGLNYPYGALGGSARNLHLVERFRRLDAKTLEYTFTIDEPTTFTKPWTVSMPMRPAPAIFEYACHEGNYGMMNILRGHRAEEGRAEKEPARK